MEADLLIKNGMVLDGTGKPAVRADLAVQGDRIVDVGHFPGAGAGKIIDAAGTISPSSTRKPWPTKPDHFVRSVEIIIDVLNQNKDDLSQ